MVTWLDIGVEGGGGWGVQSGGHFSQPPFLQFFSRSTNMLGSTPGRGTSLSLSLSLSLTHTHMHTQSLPLFLQLEAIGGKL